MAQELVEFFGSLGLPEDAGRLNGEDEPMQMDEEMMTMAQQPSLQSSVSNVALSFSAKDASDLAQILEQQLGDESTQGNVWSSFIEAKISMASIRAFFQILLSSSSSTSDNNNNPATTTAMKVSCVSTLSAKCYLLLLSISGGRSRLFDAIAVRQALKTIQMALRAVEDQAAAASRSSGKGGKGKKKRGRAAAVAAAEDGDDEEFFNEENNDNSLDDSGIASSQQQQRQADNPEKIVQAGHEAFDAFVRFLKTQSLEEDEEILTVATEMIAQLALAGAPAVSEKAMEAAIVSLQEQHGALDSRLQEVMKACLSVMLPRSSATAPDVRPATRKRLIDLFQRIGSCPIVAATTVPFYDALDIFVQHMCMRALERADPRSCVADSIVSIVTTVLPPSRRLRHVRFIAKLARNAKLNLRLLACEVSGGLLSSRLDVAEAVGGSQAVHAVLVGILMSRMNDKNPTVRARALACLSSAVSAASEAVQAAMKSSSTPSLARESSMVLTRLDTSTDANDVSLDASMDASQQQGSSTQQSVHSQQSMGMQIDAFAPLPPGDATLDLSLDTSASADSVPTEDIAPSHSEESFLALLARRCNDAKSGVRRAAIGLASSFILSRGKEEGEDEGEVSETVENLLQVMVVRCRDAGLAVRKQALSSLVDCFLHLQPTGRLTHVTLIVVLEATVDSETTMQELALESIVSLLLTPLASKRAADLAVAWQRMESIELSDHLSLLQRASKSLLAKKPSPVPSGILTALQDHIRASEIGLSAKSAWSLLEELALVSPSKFDVALFLERWSPPKSKSNDSSLNGSSFLDTSVSDADSDSIGDERAACLRVISALAPCIMADQAKIVAARMLKRLKSLAWHPTECRELVAALERVCCEKADSEQTAQAMLKEWSESLFALADDRLHNLLFPLISSSQEETKNSRPTPAHIIACVFLAGEVALRGHAKCPTRLIGSVQTLIAPMDKSLLVASATDYVSIQGHALAAVGKFCLRDEALAKKCVPTLLRELQTAKDAVTRSNVLVVLCDLCVKYTGMVDRYVGQLALSLRDESHMVRHSALILLTNLLRADYVKWKDSLFFRFLVATVDSSEVVRSQAKDCLLHILLPKVPLLCSTCFIESIFVLNDCTDTALQYNGFASTPAERAKFSLASTPNPADAENAKKRREIYSFLLSQCTDEQKCGIAAKLAEEILGGVVDGVINPDASNAASGVIADVLHVLSSSAIRVGNSSGNSNNNNSNTNNADGEQQQQDALAAELEQHQQSGPAAAAMLANATKSKLLQQLERQNMIQNVLPAVTTMRQHLKQKKSPLLREVMQFLCAMAKDSREMLKELAAIDKELVAEIQYEIKQAEPRRPPLAAAGAKGKGGPVLSRSQSQPARNAVLSPALTPKLKGGKHLPRTASKSNDSSDEDNNNDKEDDDDENSCPRRLNAVLARAASEPTKGAARDGSNRRVWNVVPSPAKDVIAKEASTEGAASKAKRRRKA